MDKIEDLQESRAPTVIGVVTFMLSFTTVAVGLRIYTRAFILRQMGLDDWTAIFTLCMAVVCGFFVAWNTRFGFGRHVYILDGPTIQEYMKTFYFSIVFYNVSLIGVKMTFLFQYYRILSIQKMRKILIAATIFVGGWSLSQLFVQIFICTPIKAFWDSEAAKTGKCIPNIPQWYINAGGNILTDIMVLVLPLPIISNLKLHKSQKLVLVGIFCLGFFTCTISIVRIKFLKLTEDFTWENVDAAAWSVGEICSGITCACLPTLRPLVAKAFPRLGASRVGASGYGYYRKGGSHVSRTDPERGVHGGVVRSGKKGAGFDSLTDSKYELTHAGSREDVQSYEMDGKAMPIAGAGHGKALDGSRPRDTIRMNEMDISHVEESGSDRSEMFGMQPQQANHGPYIQTDITFGGRDAIKSPGKIKVDCDIVQVTSSASGVRERGDMF